MISHQAIEQLPGQEGIGWITALKSASIRTLLKQDHLQLGLFDERNLFEMIHPHYPGERLAACRNVEINAFTHTLGNGTPVHSLSTVLAEIGTIVRNTCRMPNTEPTSTFQITTTANPKQHRALQLIRRMPV